MRRRASGDKGAPKILGFDAAGTVVETGPECSLFKPGDKVFYAGSILRQGEEVKGLTTAASIWVAASIGMAVGFAYYGVAIFTTLVVVIVLVALKPMEDRVFPLRRNRRRDDPKADRPAE